VTEWREVTLGDVIELKRGYDLPNAARRPGSVPVVSSSGVSGHHAVAKVAGPGVVTGRTGTLGQVFYVDEDFWPLNTSLYVRDFKGNEPYFVAALLQSMDLAQHDGAAAVPGVNRNQLHTVLVRVPGLDGQRQIAAVLRGIDNLIENNRRRVALLEEMARAIHREWFLRFRYPGHDEVPLVASPLGPIPEGWSAATVGDTATNFDRLRRPLSGAQRASRPGSVPYYGAAKLIDWIDSWTFDGEYLLFAEDGSVQTPDGFPVLQLVEGKFWANNHTHILQGSGVSTRFLYLSCARQPISGFVTGAAQPKITQANLNRVPVLVAPPPLQRSFEALIDPVFDEAIALKRANAGLAALRDLLLPRLVSGAIDVSSLDLDVELERASA
jgi:type I restriction enzyme S subunit